MKRITALILLFVAVIALFCSCSLSKNKDKAVARVNDEYISSSVYKYLLSNLKTQIGNVETVDGLPAAEYASKKALEASVELYVTGQRADEFGVKFTASMNKKLEQQVATLKTQAGTQQKYLDNLSSYGLTEETYKLLLKYTLLQEEVKKKAEAGYTSERINDFYNNHMVNVQNILFKTTDTDDKRLSEKEAAAKKKLADSTLERIRNGESFSALKAEYNEDTDNTDLGYMVSKYSNFVEPFINAAMKLEVNEVSEVIESRYGYQIIKRFNHVDNSEMFTSAQTDILSCIYQQDVEKWINEADIEYYDDVIASVGY